jgi:hypothetical protein
MKVSELAYMMDSLVTGLSRIRGATAVANDLRTFEAAMKPFADRSVTDFTSFLLQCEEYQRTGAVTEKKATRVMQPKKTADPNLIANAVESIKSLLNESSQGLVTLQKIEQTLKPYEKLTKPQLIELTTRLGIAGKASTKAQALNRIKQVLRAQVEMGEKVRLIRDSASQSSSS